MTTPTSRLSEQRPSTLSVLAEPVPEAQRPLPESTRITGQIIAVLKMEIRKEKKMEEWEISENDRQKLEETVEKIIKIPLRTMNPNTLPRVDSSSFSPCTTPCKTPSEEEKQATEIYQYMLSALEYHNFKPPSQNRKQLKEIALEIIQGRKNADQENYP